MPMKSSAQRKYLWATNPKVAEEFEKHTPKGTKLPEHVSARKESKNEHKEKPMKLSEFLHKIKTYHGTNYAGDNASTPCAMQESREEPEKFALPGGLKMLPFQGGLIAKSKTAPNLEEGALAHKPKVGSESVLGAGPFVGTPDQRGHGDGIVNRLTNTSGGLHNDPGKAVAERVAIQKSLIGMGVPVSHPKFGREATTRWIEAAANVAREKANDPVVSDYLQAAQNPGSMDITGKTESPLDHAAKQLVLKTARLHPWLNIYQFMAHKEKQTEQARQKQGQINPSVAPQEEAAPEFQPSIKPAEDMPSLKMATMPGERARNPENQTQYSRMKHMEDLWKNSASKEQAIDSISKNFLVDKRNAAESWRRFLRKKLQSVVHKMQRLFHPKRFSREQVAQFAARKLRSLTAIPTPSDVTIPHGVPKHVSSLAHDLDEAVGQHRATTGEPMPVTIHSYTKLERVPKRKRTGEIPT